MITITMKNGDKIQWLPQQYDTYRYDGKVFSIIRNDEWIAFYNIDCIIAIIIDPTE